MVGCAWMPGLHHVQILCLFCKSSTNSSDKVHTFLGEIWEVKVSIHFNYTQQGLICPLFPDARFFQSSPSLLQRIVHINVISVSEICLNCLNSSYMPFILPKFSTFSYGYSFANYISSINIRAKCVNKELLCC